MGLENPTFIAELVETNPIGLVDFRSEGDDHLRAVKRAIKNTFPGFTGRMFRKRGISVSGPLSLNDNGSLIQCSQTLTLTPDAASVLGAWSCTVRADGGAVTVDPPQNINGHSSMVIPSGYSGILWSDGVEFFMSLVFSELPGSVQVFPTGTKMGFHQTSAPIGWTKLISAAYDNATIRTTTGTVGTGGSDAFTTLFGSGKNTAGHSLTEAENGPHVHSEIQNVLQNNNAAGAIPDWIGTQGGNTGSSGSGSAHTHPLNNMNLKFVDFIVASID